MLLDLLETWSLGVQLAALVLGLSAPGAVDVLMQLLLQQHCYWLAQQLQVAAAVVFVAVPAD